MTTTSTQLLRINADLLPVDLAGGFDFYCWRQEIGKPREPSHIR